MSVRHVHDGSVLITLREPLRSDLEAVAAIVGDPRTSRYIPAGTLADLDACDRLLRRWIHDWEERRIGYWVIEQRSSREILGWGGVRFIEAGNVELLNMAYRVAFDYWGQSIATQAVTRACTIAKKRHPGVAVIARTAPENTASERTALRAGLYHVGRDRWGWNVLADRGVDAAILNDLAPA